MNPIAFRPRTATEIVDVTFRICRTNYPALVTVMIVITAPALVLGLFPPLAGLAGLMQNMLFTVADGAVIAIVSEVYLGRRAEVVTGLRAVGGRIGRLIGASILRNLAIMLGLILLVVPGLFMILATFAVPMAIVIENRSVGESFTRARQLVEENLWHAVRALLLLFVIVFGLIVGFVLTLGIVTGTLGVEGRLADMLLNVALILVYPLLSVGGTMLYYDLRIRTEGFDLEMMLENLGAGPTQVPRATAASPIT